MPFRAPAGVLAALLAAAALALVPASAAAAPSVWLTAMPSGTVLSGSVSLSAGASTDTAQVKWFVDGDEVGWDGTGPVWSDSWNSSSVSDGAHTLQARAADWSGDWGSSANVSVTVRNDSAAVTVTSPKANSTVSGTVTLSAGASAPSGIDQVKWYVDGDEVGWDGTSSWIDYWDSRDVSDGTHKIVATAQTYAGNWISSSASTFTVDNGGATPVPPPGSSSWRLIMSEGFDGSSVDTTKWRVMGPNWTGNAGFGLRDGRAVSIQNGVLTITARMIDGKLVSGGIQSRIEQRYGRYEFRVRTDPDPSQATSAVALTWPQSGNWPIDGENNIYETMTSSDRTPFSSYVHYSSQNRQYWFHHDADGTQWHKMAMEWEPSAIRIYRDGALVWTVTDTYAIPDVAHHLNFQFDAYKNWMTGSPRMQVDDVRIYARG